MVAVRYWLAFVAPAVVVVGCVPCVVVIVVLFVVVVVHPAIRITTTIKHTAAPADNSFFTELISITCSQPTFLKQIKIRRRNKNGIPIFYYFLSHFLRFMLDNKR
jgi:hypothetical protein